MPLPRYGNESSSEEENQEDRSRGDERRGQRETRGQILVSNLSRFGTNKGRFVRGSAGREDGACCPCLACTCPYHLNARNRMIANEGGQKRALEKSKALFLHKRYPSTEDKTELLVTGLQIKTINKWFINYRYTMFVELRRRARTLTCESTEADVDRLVTRGTRIAFAHVLSSGRELNESCKDTVNVYLQAWLKALKEGQDTQAKATKAVQDMEGA
ncbi:uncharacterized protein LOC118560198 [Fundulus heteroclitus]|uniref:uncharacterized protein LOC118560198 n=1 Tax=Fundulus heteroclitus TaxID=8078 RepID=UPI00165A8A64|nr:uncharacterized protein LOC118560198 [Fundulus heteroclitus]